MAKHSTGTRIAMLGNRSMSRRVSSTMKTRIKFDIARLLTTILSIPWRGWVMAVTWSWFVVPLGVPAIGMWHGAALLMLASWPVASALSQTENTNDAKKTASQKEKAAKDLFIRTLAACIILPAFVLGFGWLYASLMG